MKYLWMALGLLTVSYAQEGAQLLEKKCASCHMLQKPKIEQMGSFSAPPMDAVVFHLKDAIKGRKAQEAFIVDYVFHPDASKSVCESNKVAHFGVMPSMKGKVSKEDLQKIATYLLEHYPHPKFVAMINEMLRNDTMRALQNSPFLINSERLPHLTKLLIQNWDKAKLGLTAEQKTRLLKVRKETLSGIKRIKASLAPLEEEVADAMVDRESPDSVDAQLKQIAQLKLEATKIHLKCIADTTSILSDEQLEVLLPFWE